MRYHAPLQVNMSVWPLRWPQPTWTTTDTGEPHCAPVSEFFFLTGQPWTALDEGTGATSSSIKLYQWVAPVTGASGTIAL